MSRKMTVRDRMRRMIGLGDVVGVKPLSFKGEDPWIAESAWTEHEEQDTPPSGPPVPEPEVPICGVEGIEEGQYTTCVLSTDHRYKNGNPSPHVGLVQVKRTWPNSGTL